MADIGGVYPMASIARLSSAETRPTHSPAQLGGLGGQWPAENLKRMKSTAGVRRSWANHRREYTDVLPNRPFPVTTDAHESFNAARGLCHPSADNAGKKSCVLFVYAAVPLSALPKWEEEAMSPFLDTLSTGAQR
jgi:hypothetical protein